MSALPSLNPLKPPEARKLIRQILEFGRVEFTCHAIQEMANDQLQTTDCINVLRGGVVEPPEHENGEWRYRVSTSRMCVVMTFAPEQTVRVVTVWRM